MELLQDNELSATTTHAKPFLRWAGGKTWLLKHLKDISIADYINYHEPFLGGGAVFLFINPAKRSFLSDLNAELIETYRTVKENVEDVIDELRTFENTEEFYYRLRNSIFSCKSKRAAKFIYLNQTSYNGIYRVNQQGIYNVPYGFRSKNFLEAENLRCVSYRLKDAMLQAGDFEIVLQNLKRGDLVFLDPPYTVSHNNNGFIKYNQKLFSIDDQYRLSALIDKIKSKGAYYILTNAAHGKIIEIFDKSDSIIELNRANLIGGTKAKRGHTTEYVFTNIALS